MDDGFFYLMLLPHEVVEALKERLGENLFLQTPREILRALPPSSRGTIVLRDVVELCDKMGNHANGIIEAILGESGMEKLCQKVFQTNGWQDIVMAEEVPSDTDYHILRVENVVVMLRVEDTPVTYLACDACGQQYGPEDLPSEELCHCACMKCDNLARDCRYTCAGHMSSIGAVVASSPVSDSPCREENRCEHCGRNEFE